MGKVKELHHQSPEGLSSRKMPKKEGILDSTQTEKNNSLHLIFSNSHSSRAPFHQNKAEWTRTVAVRVALPWPLRWWMAIACWLLIWSIEGPWWNRTTAQGTAHSITPWLMAGGKLKLASEKKALIWHVVIVEVRYVDLVRWFVETSFGHFGSIGGLSNHHQVVSNFFVG